MSIADGMAWESEHGQISGPERWCAKCFDRFPLGHIHECAKKYSNPVLNEREKTHGGYADTARISQDLKDVLREVKGYRMLNHMQRESLDCICMKMARVLSGDPDHKDSWEDISGYANLVSERL